MCHSVGDRIGLCCLLAHCCCCCTRVHVLVALMQKSCILSVMITAFIYILLDTVTLYPSRSESTFGATVFRSGGPISVEGIRRETKLKMGMVWCVSLSLSLSLFDRVARTHSVWLNQKYSFYFHRLLLFFVVDNLGLRSLPTLVPSLLSSLITSPFLTFYFPTSSPLPSKKKFRKSTCRCNDKSSP